MSSPISASLSSTGARAVLTLALALVWGCGSPEIVRPPPVKLIRATTRAPQLPLDEAPPKEAWDHWIKDFSEFMSPAEMREHLSLPLGQRLLARPQRLMDLMERKRLLDEVRDQMSPAEIERFRALESYAECQALADEVRERQP